MAVITPGYNLPAKYIIHAVGPRWIDGNHDEPQLLRKCYQSALCLAQENGCHSIAFPLISSGIYGYPKQGAWSIALKSISKYLHDHPDYSISVIIAAIDDSSLQLGKTILADLTSQSFNIEANENIISSKSLAAEAPRNSLTISIGPNKTRNGAELISVSIHKKNTRKVVLTFDDGKTQIIDLAFALAQRRVILV